MAGPWERYQQEPTKQQASASPKPWERYGSSGPAAPAQSYGKRTDGSEKGMGYFGELQRPDGDFSTEISVGVDYGSGEKEIPTLVPTLTEEEKAYLLEGNDPTDEIMDKAIRHAIMREEQGLSPFAGPDDYPKPSTPPASPQSEQPMAPAGADNPGVLERIGELFTGSGRQTRATQELPELQSSGLLAGLDIPAAKAASLAATISTMTDPEEIAQTLKAVSPEIGIQYDEKGNILAANNLTGARAVINKPGFSGLDAAQVASIGSAFAPAGRLANAAGGGIAPYAGWLYFGMILERRGRQFGVPVNENFEVDLGFIGPESFAQQAQAWWHTVGGWALPRGWDNQLKTEPAIDIKYNRQWKFATTSQGVGLEFIPNAGFSLGNVMTYAGAGAMVRFGYNIPDDFGVQTIDSLSNSTGDSARRTHPFGWYLYAGVDGRAVVHNAFLDGNLYQPSPHVTKQPLVADFKAGIVFAFRRFDIAGSFVQRTCEYKGQPRCDRFGSISINATF